jgi:hypothetical protein
MLPLGPTIAVLGVVLLVVAVIGGDTTPDGFRVPRFAVSTVGAVVVAVGLLGALLVPVGDLPDGPVAVSPPPETPLIITPGATSTPHDPADAGAAPELRDPPGATSEPGTPTDPGRTADPPAPPTRDTPEDPPRTAEPAPSDPPPATDDAEPPDDPPRTGERQPETEPRPTTEPAPAEGTGWHDVPDLVSPPEPARKHVPDPPPADPEPGLPAGTEPPSDADDRHTGALADACFAWDLAACDALYLAAPADSQLQAFGGDCGGWLVDTDGRCEEYEPLTALTLACESGDFGACGELYWNAPVGSQLEDYGYTCGFRYDPAVDTCT